MLALRNAVVLGLAWATGTDAGDDALTRDLQQVLTWASRIGGGIGLSAGIVLPDNRTVSVSAGFRSFGFQWPQAVQPSDRFAMGSTTKMYTAAAVLRLVEAGRLVLDIPALPLLDRLYTRLNHGASIYDKLGSQLHNVTVRQLLQMRSGVPDFDNSRSRGYQMMHPTEDIDPIRSIAFANCTDDNNPPGAVGTYSSTNYELLGLLLAQQANASSWDTYSQASGLPAAVMGEMENTTFPLKGTCGAEGTVHGYVGFVSPLGKDAFDMSCLNGWTCGNVVSTATDAARFVRALLGPGERVLNATTQMEMLKTTPLDSPFLLKGTPYGLGIMDLSKFIGAPAASGACVGHGGSTYGFNAVTAYLRDMQVGLSVAGNNENMLVVEGAFKALAMVLKSHLDTANIDKEQSIKAQRGSEASTVVLV